MREILTLLCCITISSSRGNQHIAQEVAQLHQLVVGYKTLFPIALLGAMGAGGRAGSASHVGVVSAGKL